jgi:hypothetical protein
MSLTADELATCRAAARKRQQRKRNRLHQRHQMSLAVAQKAGDLLKRQF